MTKLPDVYAIFNEAAERESEEDRNKYLDEACQDAPRVRARVETLLRAHSDPRNLLGGVSSAVTVDMRAEIQPGAEIGRYKLLQEIGEGGFGVVYMAEQREPVRRKVALKIIKPGMDTRQVIARFEAERQALAMMDHPNIAHVFDGGATETGRPYFVMELVHGMPITKYCDEARLTTDERLKLFISVCDAVQHAHQKGIIHRDIKPSNVLVTLHGDTPVIKVIDFGVAKATDRQLTEKTVFTGFGELIGTPLYMSPEQMVLCGLDVDIRSDIYSLGVLLYELLSGVPSFDPQRLRNLSLEEIHRMIREEEPLKPSTRFSTVGEAATTLAECRKIEPAKLSQTLRGELDWIVMKALEKDRDRRYETAKHFARDVQHYLTNEPVHACPPSTLYLLKKSVRRNRAILTTLSLVFLSLVIGVCVSLWQASEATKAYELANLRLQDTLLEKERAERALKKAEENEAYARELAYAGTIRLAFLAWQNGDVRHFTDLLERHKPVGDKSDLRGFEWYFLRQLAKGDCRTIVEGTDGSNCAGYSRQGEYLVSGHSDGTLRVWDGKTFQPIATLDAHDGAVWGIDFAADGQSMASTGDDGMIRLWNTGHWKEVRAFHAHDEGGKQVSFALGDTVLASFGDGRAIRLWDTATGQPVDTLYLHANPVTAMDVSPDGQICVSGEDAGANSSVVVMNLQTHEQIYALNNPNSSHTRCCRFSPNGTQIAIATDDKKIRLMDVETGELMACFSGHEDDIQDMSFHPTDPLLVSCDRGGVIRTWNLDLPATTSPASNVIPEGKWPTCFRGHQTRIRTIEFSSDGQEVVSASNDGTVRAWRGTVPPREELTEAIQGRDAAFSQHLNGLARSWEI